MNALELLLTKLNEEYAPSEDRCNFSVRELKRLLREIIEEQQDNFDHTGDGPD